MKANRALTILIAGALGLIFFGSAPAEAQRKSRKQKMAELKIEADALAKKIDQDIQWLFRYQVEAGWYRNRLLSLQGQWKDLMTRAGVTKVAKQSKFKAPPATGFRIDAVVGSEELSLSQALLKPGCARMRGCRLWLRISFGKDYTKSNTRLEVSADLTAATGRRYAVPTKEFSAKSAVMVVDVSLDRIYLPKGRNTGTVKVFGSNRIERKTFTLNIASK